MSLNEHKHVTGLTVLPQQKCHKKWTKLQSLLCCLHFFFVAFLCRYLCSFFLSFCVYNFVVRLHLFEVVLYRFCISLWLFFFTFLKQTFLCLSFFVQVLQIIVNSWTLFSLCAITLFSYHFRYCCFVSFVCFLFICSHFWSFCGTCGVFLCNFWISLWKVYSSLSAHISQHLRILLQSF